MNCICCGRELRLLVYRSHNNLYCSDGCRRSIESLRRKLRLKEEGHKILREAAKKKEKNTTRWTVYHDPGEYGFSRGAVIPSIEQTLVDGNLNPGTVLKKNMEYYLVCGVSGHPQSLTKLTEVQAGIASGRIRDERR